MNGVQYFSNFLMKGSAAYELYEAMKKEPSTKAKLDAHLKEVNKNYIPLSTHLVNFKIGNPVDSV